MKLKKPKLIVSDFDGTLTHGHRITSELSKILELCKSHDIPFIVHTGRSISWAHFLATHYDEIPFAIAEGGGVYVHRGDNGLLKEVYLVSEADREKLHKVALELPKLFSGLELSKDSLGRVTDRAIELRDLADHADQNIVDKVQKYFDEQGVNYSQSNVHVNFWCGEIDKLVGFKFFLQREFKDVLDSGPISLDDIWFFGDSMNDAPMFEQVKHSIGVSNISAVLPKLKELNKAPKIILTGPENEGPMGVYRFLQEHL